QTGQHVDVQFTIASYKHKYKNYLKTLQDFNKQMKNIRIIPKLCQSLTKCAQKHAKILDQPAVCTVQVNNIDIESVKKN
ncbi:hypothetical protein ARMGADRAFT_927316, partial [Armillaria gallica]